MALLGFSDSRNSNCAQISELTASNTGPVLVMRFEAGTRLELDAIKHEVEEAVAEERKKRPA